MAASLGGSTLRLLRPMTLLVAAFRGLMVSGSAFAATFGWIGTVIEVVGAGIASVVGAVFSPIGALIAAVVAVILASCFVLWKYWDRFSSFVKGFARGIAHALVLISLNIGKSLNRDLALLASGLAMWGMVSSKVFPTFGAGWEAFLRAKSSLRMPKPVWNKQGKTWPIGLSVVLWHPLQN
nr:hypothetical protein [Bartonella washoeensis]